MVTIHVYMHIGYMYYFSPAFVGDTQDHLLIIQCDSGHLYGDLIACARYRIEDEREKTKTIQTGRGKTHVILIIELPHHGDPGTDRSTFVGFQGGAWISAHIDDIRAPGEGALTLDDALNAPISELFYNTPFDDKKMEAETTGTGVEDMEIEHKNLDVGAQDVSTIEVDHHHDGRRSEGAASNDQPDLHVKMVVIIH